MTIRKNSQPSHHQPFIPKWGYWAIGSLLLVIISTYLYLLTKSKFRDVAPTRYTTPQIAEKPATVAPPKTDMTIIEHTTKIPHKQSFKILLPYIVAEEELVELTKELGKKYQIGGEKIFINWWLPNQIVTKDICWAHSKIDNNKVSFGFNTDSLEQHLDVVELKPLHAPNEIGLWYWNLGDTSHYIQILRLDENTVSVYRLFSDGSNSLEEKKLISQNPLVFLWTREKDIDKEYFEINSSSAVIKDDLGIAVTLDRIR